MAEPLNHLHVAGFSEVRPFQSTLSVRKAPVPPRNRATHGARLLQQLVALSRNADEITPHVIARRRDKAVLVLHLPRVGQMDCAGFQLLALAKQVGNQPDHALRIVGHGPAVREVIEFFNMAAFFGDPLVIPAGEQA